MEFGFVELISTNGTSHLVHIDMIVDVKHKEDCYRIFFINHQLDFNIDEQNYKKLKVIIFE